MLGENLLVRPHGEDVALSTGVYLADEVCASPAVRLNAQCRERFATRCQAAGYSAELQIIEV